MAGKTTKATGKKNHSPTRCAASVCFLHLQGRKASIAAAIWRRSRRSELERCSRGGSQFSHAVNAETDFGGRGRSRDGSRHRMAGLNYRRSSDVIAGTDRGAVGCPATRLLGSPVRFSPAAQAPSSQRTSNRTDGLRTKTSAIW
jgi:hypothetical protein